MDDRRFEAKIQEKNGQFDLGDGQIIKINGIDMYEYREITSSGKLKPLKYKEKPQSPNEPCRCGSGKKFKKCCRG